MVIEQWPPDRPRPYPRNPRKIPEAAVAKVAASIREFGFRQPVVVDSDGVVVVGHTRLLAAQKLGITSIPVHIAKDLTAEQIKAYRLADNRANQESAWEPDILGLELLDLRSLNVDLSLTGFDKQQILETVNLGGCEASTERSRASHSKLDQLEFKVVVDCSDEHQQSELLERFKGEGLKCRALIS